MSWQQLLFGLSSRSSSLIKEITNDSYLIIHDTDRKGNKPNILIIT